MTENNQEAGNFDSLSIYDAEKTKGMLAKYKSRESNHWSVRIELGTKLLNKFRSYRGHSIEEISILDVGCSIGTFAIEYAKLGYKTYGVDFSPSAIDAAKTLSKEEKVNVEFICADLRDSTAPLPKVDVAIAMDFFEHLLDDELITMLVSLKTRLNKDGVLLFHTFPTQFEPIFYNRKKPYLSYPLIPFRKFPQKIFEKIARIYFGFFNLIFVAKHGQTYVEKIKKTGHCNPTTKARLSSIFDKVGFEILSIETGNLYFELSNTWRPFYRRFENQSISHRHIYGICRKKES